MANDQSRDENRDQSQDQGREQQRDRTIGAGMSSPDSTQMPLKASTGEPDWETQTNRGGSQGAGGADESSSGSSPRGGRQNTGGSPDV